VQWGRGVGIPCHEVRNRLGHTILPDLKIVGPKVLHRLPGAVDDRKRKTSDVDARFIRELGPGR
jgi:hypothetical protein